MTLRVLVTVLGLALATTTWAQPGAANATTVIVVRHAERAPGETDPPLSAAGERRARALSQLLRDTGVGTIITSQFLRTAQTAAPLAKLLNITPKVFPADQLDAVVAHIKSLAGGTVLVVHHSNTVPVIVEKLGGRTPAMPETEFDRLLIVTLPSGGSAAVTTLRYGAAPAR